VLELLSARSAGSSALLIALKVGAITNSAQQDDERP